MSVPEAQLRNAELDRDRLVDLLLEAGTLKRVPRAGWQMRGVPHVESVAEHTFGVAFLAMVMAEILNAQGDPAPRLDLSQVLVMALLHDLAEVRLTDLPASAMRLISAQVKDQAEAAALQDLLSPLPDTERLAALWRAFQDGTSAEGLLVRDADKLEMMLQCLSYEEAGSWGLGEFWLAMDGHEWHNPLCAELYARLRELRRGTGEK